MTVCSRANYKCLLTPPLDILAFILTLYLKCCKTVGTIAHSALRGREDVHVPAAHEPLGKWFCLNLRCNTGNLMVHFCYGRECNPFAFKSDIKLLTFNMPMIDVTLLKIFFVLQSTNIVNVVTMT